MKLRTFFAVLFIAGLAAACASAGGAGTSNNRDLLTRAELEASDQQDLYRLVENLRPQWLQSRGQTSAISANTGATVFVGGSNVGSAEYLRNLPPSSVESLRYWPAAQAANRFGMGHPDGVIEVTLRR